MTYLFGLPRTTVLSMLVFMTLGGIAGFLLGHTFSDLLLGILMAFWGPMCWAWIKIGWGWIVQQYERLP